jgi:hypothetical protein
VLSGSPLKFPLSSRPPHSGTRTQLGQAVTDLLSTRSSRHAFPISNSGGAPGYEPELDGSHGAGGTPPAPSAPRSNEPSLSDLALRCAPELTALAVAVRSKDSPWRAAISGVAAGVDLAKCLSDAMKQTPEAASVQPARDAQTAHASEPVGNSTTRLVLPETGRDLARGTVLDRACACSEPRFQERSDDRREEVSNVLAALLGRLRRFRGSVASPPRRRLALEPASAAGRACVFVRPLVASLARVLNLLARSLWSDSGQAPLRIKVIDVSGDDLTMTQAFRRELLNLPFALWPLVTGLILVLEGRNPYDPVQLPEGPPLELSFGILGLELMSTLGSRQRRALHDLFAHSLVVRLDADCSPRWESALRT